MLGNGLLCGRKGFTLIELLVVIAIIAVLAAILFPVFVNAKTSAKCSTDVQSQRQMGLGLCMYADQNGGKFPWISRADTLRHFPSYPNGTNTTISGELIIALKPYVNNTRVFYCPAVDVYGKQYTHDWQSKQDPPFQYIGYYYYAGAGWGGYYDQQNRPQPVTQAGSPKRILVSCIGQIGTSPGGEGISGHGRARGIFTFADGHAKYLYHYKYPYSSSECTVGGVVNVSKILMPKWEQ